MGKIVSSLPHSLISILTRPINLAPNPKITQMAAAPSHLSHQTPTRLIKLLYVLATGFFSFPISASV